MAESCGKPYVLGGVTDKREVFAPCSIGLATGAQSEDPFALIKNAELALISAKKQGGACARVYSSDLENLAPGSWIARATAAGYETSELQTEVRAGQQSSLTLRLHKEAPKAGELVITVTNKEGGAPIAGASVKLQDQEKVTDEKGSVTFAELPPGALSLQVHAAGYRPGEEVAQVVAGRSGTVPVLLFKEKKQIPATISGIVRSVRGPAVKARLEIPELSLRIFADAKGAFSLSVPAGSYRVIISAPHYRKQVKRVSVKEGDQTIFNVDLHPR